MNRIMAFVSCCLVVASPAFAAEILWTGGALEENPAWATAANWDGGAVPTTDDVAVFNLSEDLTVTATYKVHGIRVSGGNLKISGGGTVYGGESGTGTVFVAEGVRLDQTGALEVDKSGVVCEKAGGGTMVVNAKVDSSARMRAFVISGGTFMPGGSGGATGYFKPTNCVVCASATLRVYTAADGADQDKKAAIQSAMALELQAGGTFDCAGTSVSIPILTGAGRVVRMGGTAKHFENFTGSLSISAGTTFGDNANVANDPDLTTIESIDILGSSSMSPSVTFKNVTPFTLTASLTGRGRIYVYTDVNFANVNLQPSQFDVYGPFTISGGTACVYTFVAVNPNLVSTVSNGARLCGSFSSPDNAVTTLKQPRGLGFGSNDKRGSLTIKARSGGEYYSYDALPNRVEVSDGGRFFQARPYQSSSTVLFDGGDYILHSDWYGYQGFSSTAVNLHVGPDGMRIRQKALTQTSSLTLSCNIAQADVEMGDGGVDISAAVKATLNSPFSLTGPIALRGGEFSFANTTANAAAKDGLLGAGDLILGNARLGFNSALTPLVVASGEGSRLRLSGSGLLGIPVSAEQKISFGDANAAAGQGLVRDSGGVLVIVQDGDGMLYGETSQVKIGGGIPVDADTGLVKVPVFTESKSDAVSEETDIWAYRFYLAGYDATKGVYAITNYTAGLDGGAKSLARVTNSTLAEDTTARVLALNVVGGSGSRSSTPSSSDAPLKLKAGARLVVGNGIDPAYVLMNSDNSTTTAAIKGEGVLDFGASEGIVMVNRRPDACLMAKIVGNGGVTFAGPSDQNGQSLHLGANEYSGGTWINSLCVYPHAGTSFGTGDVYVGGGDYSGGRIVVSAGLDKMTFANNLHLSGTGVGLSSGGALSVSSSIDWTGDVELLEWARVNVATGTVMTVSGKVTGDRLQLFRPGSSTNEVGEILRGDFVLSGSANNYTGGTQVVRSRLVLKDGAKAGTGAIELDDGALRIDNGKDACTLANRIYGVGTVELAGRGLVDVAGRIDTAAREGTSLALDVQKNRAKIVSLDGFSSITNTLGTAVTLCVAATTPFEGPVDPRVTVTYGDVSDPGLLLIVR